VLVLVDEPPGADPPACDPNPSFEVLPLVAPPALLAPEGEDPALRLPLASADVVGAACPDDVA
jgi:hypothetical protein